MNTKQIFIAFAITIAGGLAVMWLWDKYKHRTPKKGGVSTVPVSTTV